MKRGLIISDTDPIDPELPDIIGPTVIDGVLDPLDPEDETFGVNGESALRDWPEWAGRASPPP